MPTPRASAIPGPIVITDDDIAAAWPTARRPGWTAKTLDDALSHPLYRALLRARAIQMAVRRHYAAHNDAKRLAAGDITSH